MKKLAASGLALALALTCAGQAFAMEIPTDTAVQNLNGVQQYIKTYTVAPGTDPQSLIEEPFEYEGYTYTFSSITKEEILFQDSQTHTETVTVETENGELSDVLTALSPKMEFCDGRYAGTLNLDHTTIHTEAAGYTTKSYTVSEIREIGDLDSNDMAYVPATAVKDGKTIPLQSVDWQVQGTALVDDILVPSRYKAIATYSGKAYYNAATGYITTAEYTGEVSCREIENVIYTVTYTGLATLTPDKEGNSNILAFLPEIGPYILGGLGLAAILTLAGLLAHSRKQLRILQEESPEVSEIEEEMNNET